MLRVLPMLLARLLGVPRVVVAADPPLCCNFVNDNFLACFAAVLPSKVGVGNLGVTTDAFAEGFTIDSTAVPGVLEFEGFEEESTRRCLRPGRPEDSDLLRRRPDKVSAPFSSSSSSPSSCLRFQDICRFRVQ